MNSMFLNMNQTQPSICNISPMAPASDRLSVIIPVGQAPSTVKNEGLWWSAHGLLAWDATEPESRTPSLQGKRVPHHGSILHHSTHVRGMAMGRYKPTACNVATQLYIEFQVLNFANCIMDITTLSYMVNACGVQYAIYSMRLRCKLCTA